MCYSVSRNDRETYFVDAISEFVDFAGVVVVRDNGAGTGCDTEGGIDKGLGDYGRQGDRVRSTCVGQSGECTDHTDNGTEQTDQGTQRGHRSDNRQVLLQGGQLQCGSLFETFLDRSYALFFVQGFVFLYLRIGLKSRQNYVGNRTALFCAECTGAFQVVFLEAVFHVADELGQVTATVGFADGEPALNAQYEYGEEQGLQNRYDDTSFLDSTQHVARQRMVVGVVVHEVCGVTENEVEQAHCDDEADQQNDTGRTYAANRILCRF